MQMLYQWELGGNTPEQVSSMFFRQQKADREVERFARDLFASAGFESVLTTRDAAGLDRVTSGRLPRT